MKQNNTPWNDKTAINDDFFNYPSLEQYSSDKVQDVIQQSERTMTPSDYLVAFSSMQENYCVGLVDMVNSTEISSSLNQKKLSRYYEIFLNSMSKILSKFGGFVIKNVGDCLFFYFPSSSNPNRKFGFLSCLEGCLAMTEMRNYICTQLSRESLPTMNFRISADYGMVAIMQANNSSSIDMIGPPVNMCSKINHNARTNEVVIGGDLYQMVRKFSDYSFKLTKSHSIGLRYEYPVYSVRRKVV